MKHRKHTAIIIHSLLLAVLGAASQAAEQPAAIALVPKPLEVQCDAGQFSLKADTIIAVDAGSPAAIVIAKQLQARLRASTGLDIQLATSPATETPRGAIRVAGSPERSLGSEGYRLEVTPERITIIGGGPAGMFYGTQTILQLLPPAVFSPTEVTHVGAWAVPALRIKDRPRFAWRGLMLDCSRTFQSLDYLRKTIDRLAAYKMNVLHLHLTDEQGWRMEIKKYPELTRKGARFAPEYNEPAAHEGFYTQDQLRTLVRYAADRHVTIVPEIEMPSHCIAALICRPDLACPGRRLDKIMPYDKMLAAMDKDQGNYPIYCAGNDGTFQFLEDVLDEVMAVFPATFIHVGGDEANKIRWRNCPKCQARIKQESLKDEQELQSYFIRRIEKYLNAKGRRLIGWSEILQGGLAPNAAVMDWIGGADAATKTGHDAVMSPTSHCYFDYPYSAISTERAYSFEPCARLASPQAKHILGLQASFWSHIDREPALVDRQLFPRLLALAERGWSPADVRDRATFKVRLDAQLPRLRAMGVHYRPEPFAHWTPRQVTDIYRPLLWDVTSAMTGAGRYRVTFQYTGGACRLGMESVKLLADGAVVSADRHRGMTGASDERNTYIVELKRYSPATKYELRCSARSEGGTDSHGDMYIEGPLP
jgi:hexosaminidase